MKELQIDPSKLLGFRLSVAEVEANGMDSGKLTDTIMGIQPAAGSDKLGSKIGGKLGGKIGSKGGFKRVA
jgi:hypothetical protein